MKLKTVAALYKKEITDILRDRKTVLMMILLPVVLYPLLFLLGIYAFGSISSTTNETEYRIACTSDTASTVYTALASYGDTRRGDVIVVDSGATLQELESMDVLVTLSEEASYEIQFDSSNMVSSAAADFVYGLLEAYSEALTVDMLESEGIDAEAVLHPIQFSYVNQATAKDTMGYMLGMLIPFMMIASIMMGALYPAIDVTAGEKERGTLETLLTLPVTNMELLSGKFLSVSTIALVSALLNIVSMGAVSFIWYSSMGIYLNQDTQIQLLDFVPVLFITLLCMAVFAVFITAAILCICFNTASFKEAQNMTTPLMVVVLVLSIAGIMPNLTLDQVMWIPVVNIAVLVRDLFMMDYHASQIITVLAVNMSYSVIAIFLMSRMYRSEQILFDEGMGSIRFFTRRSSIIKKPGTLPGIGDGIILCCVCLLLILTVGTYFQVRFPGVGLLGTQAICFFVPVFLAWYMKCDIKKLFSLQISKRLPLQMLGAALLWAGVYCLLLVAVPWIEECFPTGAESLEQTEQYLRSMTPWMLLFTVGIAPAICEEVLFRGFLFGTMRGRFRPTVCIVVTALLFGMYHMSLPKLFTTSILGAASALALCLTGSIIIPILMHLLNNTVSVLAYIIPQEWMVEHVSFLMTGFVEPWQKLIGISLGGILTVVGLTILILLKQPKQTAVSC